MTIKALVSYRSRLAAASTVAVYAGIDQAKLPICYRLRLGIIKNGATTPSMQKLRTAVERHYFTYGAAVDVKLDEVFTWTGEVFGLAEKLTTITCAAALPDRHPHHSPISAEVSVVLEMVLAV